MKNVLIIYPHWHPVNLAGVHRPRLIGNFLPEFGWHPIIVTVKEAYFEEKPDTDFIKTFRDHYEVYRVDAAPVKKIRLFGDIGIRAFRQLYKQAQQVIIDKPIDFIWIPVPSYYPALIGRLLYRKYKIPYGIDYIDPWVRDMKQYPSSGMRQRLSLMIAKILEPFAVKNAALISGVATSYYQGVLDRNDKQNKKIHVAMPYGFDPMDHNIEMDIKTPWDEDKMTIPYIYAGAFLPNSVPFIKLFFSTIQKFMNSGAWDANIKLYFIGTGNYPGVTLQEIANGYGLQEVVVEKRERFPFLHILYFLRKAHGVLAIGSPSPHYTASKIFQAILSLKPVFAFFHQESSVVYIMEKTNTNQFLMIYHENEDTMQLEEKLEDILKDYFFSSINWQPDLQALNEFSARASANELVNGIEMAITAEHA